MKKILIVDDQKEVRLLVDVTLRGDGYEIFQAENGMQAVDQTKTLHPDLVIMDVMMPGDYDGLEATRRIKKDPDTQDCIVVMLTAKGQQIDKQAGLEAGADYYFTKPFSPLELIRMVDEVLG